MVSGPLTGEASDRQKRSESSPSPEGGPIRAFMVSTLSILVRIAGAAGTRILHIRTLPAARVVDNSEDHKEDTMNRRSTLARSTLALSTMALLFLGIGLP